MFKNAELSSPTLDTIGKKNSEPITYKLFLPKGLGDVYVNHVKKVTIHDSTFEKISQSLYVIDETPESNIQEKKMNKNDFDTKIIDLSPSHSQKSTLDSSIVVILDRQTSASNDEDKSQIMTTSLSPLTSIEKQQVEAIMTQIHDRTDQIDEPQSHIIEDLATHLPKINKFKIDQLREMCKTHGLSTAGTKDVLFKRLKSGNFLK